MMALMPLMVPSLLDAFAAPPPRPTAAQVEWQQMELGVIIHYNMATGRGQGCGIGGDSPPAAALFQPSPTFDAAEWMESATALGAKYAVYVAKHECGFCTWPSKVKLPDGRTFPYAVGGPDNATTVDVVASFVRAAKAAAIRPALYYSLGNPIENVFLNSLHLTYEEMQEVTLAQLAELWAPARVGPLAEVWFDGGWAGFQSNITALLTALQPGAIAFGGCDSKGNCVAAPTAGNTRWVGTEAGVAPDPCWSTGVHGAGDPNSSLWNPAESDTTLQNGDNWFYDPGAGLRSLSALADVYHSTVGRNLGSRIWGQKMGSKCTRLAESERGVWFWLKRYSICTPHFLK